MVPSRGETRATGTVIAFHQRRDACSVNNLPCLVERIWVAACWLEPLWAEWQQPRCSEMRRPRKQPQHGDSRLHRVDASLTKIGLAKSPRAVGRRNRDKPGETHVVRIALTGGPCAGKSSALKRLTEVATEAGFDVYTAPESATRTDPSLVFSAVAMGFTFQTSLMRPQLSMERSLTAIAASTGCPSIIIFDRGLLDAKGYVSRVCIMPPQELAHAVAMSQISV